MHFAIYVSSTKYGIFVLNSRFAVDGVRYYCCLYPHLTWLHEYETAGIIIFVSFQALKAQEAKEKITLINGVDKNWHTFKKIKDTATNIMPDSWFVRLMATFTCVVCWLCCKLDEMHLLILLQFFLFGYLENIRSEIRVD